MKEALTQSLDNLRTNKLRSFLTMFGIMWGVISIVILSAMGEGFQRGNQAVLEELGKNIVVIRNENGRQQYHKFNYNDVIKQKRTEQNVDLKPGDTIVVP